MNIQFTIDQLEVLDAIVRAGSFAAAARSLHRATSAVSYAVKTLESALGVRLFDRSGRQVRLTASGELVIDAARQVLERSRLLERVGHDLAQGWEAQVRLVVDGVIPLDPVVAAIREFTSRRIPTRLRVMTECLSGVRRRFEIEEAQLMISVYGPADPALVAHPLPPVEMVLVARTDHPLNAQARALDRKRLASYVEVLVEDSGHREEPPPHPLAQIGGSRVLEVSDVLAKRQAILGGVGYGWLPRHLSRAGLLGKELEQLRFDEGSSYLLTPSLIHRRDVPLGPAARVLRELLLAAARSQGRVEPSGDATAPAKARRRPGRR